MMEISLVRILILLVLGYIIVGALLFFFQRKIMYIPAKNINKPSEYDLAEVLEVNLNTSDNIDIHAWYKPAAKGKETIIYFHGNAGHLGDRQNKFRAFMKEGFGLFAVSYRGYGKSAGGPTEQGLYHDARAGVSYILGQDIPLSNIILFGESLGSGIAVQMGTEFAVKAIVLEAPYTSVVKRSQELYPYMPASLLLKDRFDSLGKIKSVKSPLLIMHGELDATIPVAHGRALLAAANDPKKGVFYPQVGHTDFDETQLISDIRTFLTSL